MNVPEFLFVVIEENAWYNKDEDPMLFNCNAKKVFNKLDSAVDFVLHEVANLASYGYKIGIRDKDISIGKMMDKEWVGTKYMYIEFPEDRGHGEIRRVTWQIQSTKYEKES